MPRLDPTPEQLRERDLGRRSMVFLLDQIGAGVAGLAPTDALLVLAINQANIAPLTREPLARIRYGGLQAPAPDARRRPVSINAIAQSLSIPFETARRRVHALAQKGVVAEGPSGLIVPEAFLASPAYLEPVIAGHWRLLSFFQEVRLAGWSDELPRSAYPPEESIPMRAAARLLADYVLRTSANLLALAEGVTPSIVLLGMIASGQQAVSASELARRLNLPAETVRRHARKLTERRLCRATAKGFIVDDPILSRPGWLALFHENAQDVHRLFAGLAERGVVEAWARLVPPQTAGDRAQANS